MRDPARIAPMLEELRRIWEKYPDLRLLQLIVNSMPVGELFYVEDDAILEGLRELERRLDGQDG